MADGVEDVAKAHWAPPAGAGEGWKHAKMAALRVAGPPPSKLTPLAPKASMMSAAGELPKPGAEIQFTPGTVPWKFCGGFQYGVGAWKTDPPSRVAIRWLAAIVSCQKVNR